MPSTALLEECNSPKQVAEILHLRGCFSLRARKSPVLEVLTDATAALRVTQGGVLAVLWLDMVTEELYMTERFGIDVLKRQLPLRLAVTAITPAVITSDKEQLVASIAFTDRQSLELFVKLGQHVLPEWLSIREGALGTNLYRSPGHWLLRYHDMDVMLQNPGCGLTGIVHLNLHKPTIEVLMQQDQDLVRLEAVGSLQSAARALYKHMPSKQQIDSTVLHCLQHLQHTEQSVKKLQARLHASSEHAKGASSMQTWLNSGIIAALVDCAATLDHTQGKQSSLRGIADQHDVGGNSGLCSRAIAVLQGLAECVGLVLGHSAEQEYQQAGLMVDCVARSLCGSGVSQALMVAALFKMVLEAFSDTKYQCHTSSGSLWDPLWQACQDPLLWQHMLWCYSQAVPTEAQQPDADLHESDHCQHPDQTPQQQQPVTKIIELLSQCHNGIPASGPYSHPLNLFSNSEDYDDVTSPGKTAAARSQQSSDSGSTPKRPLVPRLSLPLSGQGTPAVAARSSRLSRRASDVNSAATPDALQPAPVSSALAALQQLGQNCGESLMASDLAAFVTLKQLRSGQAAVLQQGRRVLSQSSAGGTFSPLDSWQLVEEPAQLSWHELAQLPKPLQLQLLLLECLHILTSQPAASRLPASADNALLEQLLLPTSLLLHRLQVNSLQPQPLLEKALERQRHMGLQVVVRCHELKCVCGHSPSSQDDDTRDTLPRLHDSLLAQFKQRLMDYCSVKRPDPSVHIACREALLLLRDHLHLASRPSFIDTACSVLGRTLGQHEHMLRSSRVSLWSWAAVQHMDALVQLYTELVKQATGTLAVNFLLRTLGSQPSPSVSSIGGFSSSGSATGSIPGDTLHLVLEYMQQRLPTCNASAQWSAKDSGRNCSAMAQISQEAAGSPVPSGSGYCRHLNLNTSAALDKPSILSPAGRLNSNRVRSLAGISEGSPTCSERSTAGTAIEQEEAKQASTYRRHCFELFTALVELEARHVPAGVGSVSWGGSSTPARSSSLGSDAWHISKSGGGHPLTSVTMESSRRPAVPALPALHSSDGSLDQVCQQPSSPLNVQTPALINASEAGIQIGQSQPTELLSPGQGTRGGLDTSIVLNSSRSGQPVHRPVPLLLTGCMSRTSLAGSSAGAVSSDGSGPSGEVMRVLVDLLLRQRGGRTYVVQQLEELDGSQGAVLLQLEILRFLATALAVPQSVALSVPQMMDFYVHYHFLHFTRYYHRLPALATPAAVASCKGHIKVLLALSSHAGGANLVRRRFLQLKILDFLVRELSLEHNLLIKNNLLTSRSNSCCSTPQSSSRSLVAPSSGRCLLAAGPSSSRAGYAQAPGTPVSRLSTVSLTPIKGQGSVTAVATTPQLLLQDQHDMSKDTPAAARPVTPVAACCDSAAAAAVASLTQQKQAGSRLRGRSSCRRSRASTPELPSTAGRRSPGIASYSRVVAKQRHRSATAAAVPVISAADVSPGTSVKQAVKLFEAAAAAAASPPAGPCRGRRVQSAGRRLLLPSSLTAGGVTAVRDTASTRSKEAQELKQQSFISRPPEASRPTASAGRGFRGVPRLTLAGPAGGNAVCLEKAGSSDAAVSSPALHDDADELGRKEVDRPRSCTPVEGGSSSGKSSSEKSLDPHMGSEVSSMRSKPSPKAQPIGDLSWDEQSSSASDEQSDHRLHSDGILSSGDELDDVGVAETSPGPGMRSVPRLVFNAPNNLQTSATAAQTAAAVIAESETDAESEYKPGLDLEEDFERMMLAEESGLDGDGWNLSSTGSGDADSECSSLIAAGREDCASLEDERQQQSVSVPAAPSSTCASSPLLPLGKAALKGVEGAGRSVVLEGCGVHDEELEEQLLVVDAGEAHLDTGVDRMTHRTPARQSLVPHLNLSASITASSRAQQQLVQQTEPDSRGSNTSALTPNTRPQAPSLLATATPLYTTRTPQPAAATTAIPPIKSKGEQQQQSIASAPAGTAAMAAATPGHPPSARSAAYSTQRHACAVYADQELHILCLELALHLLGTPLGLLDQLQLPQDPSDGSLQHKVLVLLDHLSHSENQAVVQLLAQRAQSQTHTHQESTAAPPERLGRSSHDSWVGQPAAQSDNAGLGTCTLRLLKLLSRGMLNSTQLQLGAMIQKGAFSEIFAGTWSRSGEPVAVAVKAIECGDNNYSCFERVFNEVAILESLQGQHGIVPLLEYGVMADYTDSSSATQPQWVLVFPRYSGSLREWRLRRGQGLGHQDIELYLNIFLQVAITVRSLHAANVVHYDIKGDNLLLDHTCSSVPHNSSNRAAVPFQVILADFGDALMFDSAGAFAERHRGTELFSSPEMLLLHAGQQHPEHFAHDRRKHRGVGRPHDVWSLGCTLYELLTGKTLFEEQGVGRITSYAGSVSCAGASAASASASKASNQQQKRGQLAQNTSGRGSLSHGNGGVLSGDERAELLGHAGLIDLVEFMLVGDATRRPGAAEVVYKTQQLMLTCSHGSCDKSKNQ